MRIRGTVARGAALGASLTLIAIATWSTATGPSAAGETRTLSMYNIHTKETLTVTFKRNGKYDEAALKEINTFMRDWRANQETKMDPALIDLVWTLHKELGSREPIHLVSAYRSAATNASMRRKGGGQAKKSQHIQGKAADIHFPDVAVKTLRNSALVREAGGVGYYPTSGIPFVHVDTGNVRMWPRIPRLELAALFPDGKTKYLPSDGKPITIKDYKLAMAKGLGAKTMVASAAGARPAADVVAEAELDAEAETAMPQPILASYTPGAADVIEDSRAPNPPGRLFTYASVGGMSIPSLFRPAPKKETAPAPAASRLPAYEDAEVAGAPEADDDHPDQLNYAPFEIAELMTDASVTYSRTLAPPEQGSVEYLFQDMDHPTGFKLRANSGYKGLAAAQRFSGQAVKALYAEVEGPAPTRLAQSTR